MNPKQKIHDLKVRLNPAIVKRLATGEEVTADWLYENYASDAPTSVLRKSRSRDNTKGKGKKGDPLKPQTAIKAVQQFLKGIFGEDGLLREHEKMDAIFGPWTMIAGLGTGVTAKDIVAEVDTIEGDGGLAAAIKAGEAARAAAAKAAK